MWTRLIVSQVFAIPSAIVSSIVWSSLFGAAPFVVPLAVWVITSLYTLSKLG